VGAHQVHLGTLELIQRSRFGCGQEPERRVERASLEAHLGGGQRALSALGRVDAQYDRPL
jgi:hypothetical protein